MSHKVEVIDGNVCVHIGTTPVADIYRHIEVMSPDEARAFVADITEAIESIAPVKIDRWLTQADIEKYGDRWMWHSDEWDCGDGLTSRIATASVVRGDVMLITQGMINPNWNIDDFVNGVEYFTPIKGEK